MLNRHRPLLAASFALSDAESASPALGSEFYFALSKYCLENEVV
jgi:hypothetical protein